MKYALSIFGAELKYQRDLFTLAVAVLLISGTIAAYFTEAWTGVMLGFGLMAYIFGAISMGSRMDNEMRERTARMLPLRPAAYGLVRFMVFVTYHLLISTIILAAIVISGTILISIPDLLALLGFDLAITAVFFINDDIFYMWGWWARTALWLCVLIIIVYGALTTQGMLFVFSPDSPKTFFDAVILNAAWIGLIALDVQIYTQRKSYLK